MELLGNLYRQILNLIRELLVTFGADTAVVDGLIAEFDKTAEDETV